MTTTTSTFSRFVGDARTMDAETLVERMTENVLRRFDKADEATLRIGEEWYAHGQRIARHIGDGDVTVGAAIVAILSPRCSWSENVARAAEYHRTGTTSTFRLSLSKLHRITVLGEHPDTVVSGPKVSAFYRNLAGDLSAVTVDVWALRAALANPAVGDDVYRKLSDGNRYNLVSEAYRRAARRRGVAPATLQAVVWIVERGSAE